MLRCLRQKFRALIHSNTSPLFLAQPLLNKVKIADILGNGLAHRKQDGRAAFLT